MPAACSRSGRVAEEHLDAEGPDHFELLGLVIEHDRLVAGRQQDPVDDAAEAAVTGNDDAAALVDLVGFPRLRPGVPRRDQLVVDDEQERRQQHRQRDDEQQPIGEPRRDDAVRDGERQQHETELARLGEAQRKEPAVAAADLEQVAEPEEHRCLEQHQPDRHAHDRAERAEQQVEVDRRADGNEEQPEQQALERRDVAFELVPVLAVREHHAGEERTQRRRQSDDDHQQRNTHDEQQGKRREQLPESGYRNVAKHGSGQKRTRRKDEGDGAQRDEPALPAVQPVHEAQLETVSAVGRFRAAVTRGFDGKRVDEFRQRQQRQESQHRDDGNVLEQQHREARVAAVAFHQPLFVEGLQHDGRRRQREDHADGQGDGPRLTERHRDRGYRQRRYAHLQPAETEKLRPHLPEYLGLQLEADQEQHHDDAELREVLNADDIDVEFREQRTQCDAREQVAEHGPEPQFRRHGNRDHAGDQEQEGEQQKLVHAPPPASIGRLSGLTVSSSSAAPMS